MKKYDNFKNTLKSKLIMLAIGLVGISCILMGLFYEYVDVICNASLFTISMGVIAYGAIEYYSKRKISKYVEALAGLFIPLLITAMLSGASINWIAYISLMISSVGALATIAFVKTNKNIPFILLMLFSIATSVIGLFEIWYGSHKDLACYLLGCYDIFVSILLLIVSRKVNKNIQ